MNDRTQRNNIHQLTENKYPDFEHVFQNEYRQIPFIRGNSPEINYTYERHTSGRRYDRHHRYDNIYFEEAERLNRDYISRMNQSRRFNNDIIVYFTGLYTELIQQILRQHYYGEIINDRLFHDLFYCTLQILDAFLSENIIPRVIYNDITRRMRREGRDFYQLQ